MFNTLDTEKELPHEEEIDCAEECDEEETASSSKASKKSRHGNEDSGRRLYKSNDSDDRYEATGTVANPNLWSVSGSHYFPCESTVDKLDPGMYVVNSDFNKGIFFSKKPITIDDLIILPDSQSEAVIKEIEQFWKKEEVFRQFKYLWKRGVLLYGPAGSGKTSTLQILSSKIIEMGGVTIVAEDPRQTAKGLEILRRIEPTRPIIVILEDIDGIVDNYGDHALLSLLDGESQIDNVVYIATTNYPEKLHKRMVNRPSRFDIVRKIGMPSSEARNVYLKHSHPALPEHERQQWVNLTNGFSVAHLKELVISVAIFDKPLEEAVIQLRKMMSAKLNSDQDEERSIGFTE